MNEEKPNPHSIYKRSHSSVKYPSRSKPYTNSCQLTATVNSNYLIVSLLWIFFVITEHITHIIHRCYRGCSIATTTVAIVIDIVVVVATVALLILQFTDLMAMHVIHCPHKRSLAHCIIKRLFSSFRKPANFVSKFFSRNINNNLKQNTNFKLKFNSIKI